LSLVVGLLVGEQAHIAGLGVAVTSGVVAFLFRMEVLMVWQAKQAFQQADEVSK
jgi:hypothetical protein